MICLRRSGGQASHSRLLLYYPLTTPDKHVVRRRDQRGEARRPGSSSSPACAQHRHHRLSAAKSGARFSCTDLGTLCGHGPAGCYPLPLNTQVHTSSLFKTQTTRGSRSVGAFRAPPLPPAPVWHLLGPFKTWGFEGLGCSRPPWPQALRKRYLRVQIRSTRLRSQISESESEGQNQCMQSHR